MTLYYIRRCPFTKHTTGCVRLEAFVEIAMGTKLVDYGWNEVSCWRYWLYRVTGL